MSAADEILAIAPTVLVAGVASSLARNLEKGCVKSCKEHTKKLEVKPHSFKK